MKNGEVTTGLAIFLNMTNVKGMSIIGGYRQVGGGINPVLVLFRAGAAVRKRVRCARSAECELQLPARKFPQGWWKSREEIW